MNLRQIEKLDESYRRGSGVVFMTGLQALVRLLLDQHRLDKRNSLHTAGFVSGYRGSPLGGLDRELTRAGTLLEAADIHFEPGLNEDLAATAVWGSQQANLFPGAKFDGVFSLWYGKGPGVDRSGDAFKHGNHAGTSAKGGVLVVAGDDPTCKSSSLPSQSEYSFVDAMMPILNPSDVQELMDFGLLGFAMSRFSGCWVAFKVVQETADATQTVQLRANELEIVTPTFDWPEGGLSIRWPDPPNDQEFRLQRYKLDAALAFARANGIDKTIVDSPQARFGIVTTGKAHHDAMQALEDLGISRERAGALGIRVYKVGMNWPLEPEGIREFADGLEEIVVVEEKRGLVEGQLKELLYDRLRANAPVVVGKKDERGAWLLPSSGELTPGVVASALASRLSRLDETGEIRRGALAIERHAVEIGELENGVKRLPHFCSGCPHNTSTLVPQGSRAIGGIGCHFMAGWMDRNTVTYTQMGGEGATWIGQSPFTDTPHVFQNIGDGTYAHSGILAIRAAVAAGVNITFKILFNDAVAMTGGQKVEGDLTVHRVVDQLIAEGVGPIFVVTNEPDKYADRRGLPSDVAVRDRRELDSVQRELRSKPGVSALVYDQTCAAELHRLRKRGRMPTPERRVVINEMVCEGCGDCNVQSNCLSVMALETEFGRKRRINQSSCNQDYSCLEGFCPSFVTLEGAKRNPPKPLSAETVPNLPLPEAAPDGGVYNILIAGVGGTGVVTASGLIGLAAHLERKAVLQLDQTGLAQKFGAVLSHVRIGRSRGDMHGMRIPNRDVDLLLGVDLMVAASSETLAMLGSDRSSVIVNTHEEMPSQFIHDRDFRFPSQAMLAALGRRSKAAQLATLDATQLASALLGDSIAANIFMLGFAFQKGLLPLQSESLYRALELYGVNVEQNKASFDWGRFAAHNPERVVELATGSAALVPADDSLQGLIERRAEYLQSYQDQKLANRYRERVARVRQLEGRIGAGGEDLARAVARNYFKLLAYKDEYEVARLHSQTGFVETLRENFGNRFKLTFHFSPPLVARRDRNTGRPRKMEFGGWILPFLRLLAKGKSLRGTRLDVFGYTAERRMERSLIADYETFLDKLDSQLDANRYALAIELASLPDGIRGFGHIKAAAATNAAERRHELMKLWDNPPLSSVTEPIRESTAA